MDVNTMRILCLDAATTTGYAYWPGDETWPIYGSQKFKAEHIGERAAQFVDWLVPILNEHQVTDVAIEAPVPVRGQTTLDTIVWLYGVFWRVREISARRRMTLHEVGVSQWRSHFLGVTQAPRSLPPNKRTQWLKRRCIDECRARGFEPKDDNAADALGILSYVRALHDPLYAAKSAPIFARVAA